MAKKKTVRASTSRGLGGGFIALLVIDYPSDLLEGYGKTRRGAIRDVRSRLKLRTLKEKGLTDSKRSSCLTWNKRS